MGNYRLRKKMCWDERAALEGLPLYLIILVVITAIAIVIIITWLSTMQEPDLDSLEVSGTETDGTLVEGGSYDIIITTKGTNNKGLEGVDVKLEGAGISKTMKTQDGGTCTFTGVVPDLPSNTYTGSITVTATYSGNVPVTKTTTIPVNAP